MSCVKTREWMYVCDQDGREQLYDRTADPDESVEVSGNSGNAGALSDMRKRLAVRLMRAAYNGRERTVEY